LHCDGEVYALAARARLQSLGLLRDHPVEARERKIVGRLAAAPPRLDERLVNPTHGCYVRTRVRADEGRRGRGFRLLRARVAACGRAVTAPLLTLPHRPPPELHEGGVARAQSDAV